MCSHGLGIWRFGERVGTEVSTNFKLFKARNNCGIRAWQKWQLEGKLDSPVVWLERPDRQERRT